MDKKPGTSPSVREPQTLHSRVASPSLLERRASLVWLLHLRHKPHGDWDWKGLTVFPRYRLLSFYKQFIAMTWKADMKPELVGEIPFLRTNTLWNFLEQ